MYDSSAAKTPPFNQAQPSEAAAACADGRVERCRIAKLSPWHKGVAMIRGRRGRFFANDAF